MDDRMKGSGIAVVGGAILLLVVLALVGLATVYTGAYNIAATEEHTSLAGPWTRPFAILSRVGLPTFSLLERFPPK